MFPGHGGLDKYARHARYQTGDAHNGQNADEPVSRPNNARRPILVGSDLARMGSGTVRGDEPGGGTEQHAVGGGTCVEEVLERLECGLPGGVVEPAEQSPRKAESGDEAEGVIAVRAEV